MIPESKFSAEDNCFADTDSALSDYLSPLDHPMFNSRENSKKRNAEIDSMCRDILDKNWIPVF